jgi:hypothetical protein
MIGNCVTAPLANGWELNLLSFGLRIELADGKVIMIPSDASWRVVPEGERGWDRKQEAPAYWPKAVVVSAFLPRNGLWQERIPTMTVKVPLLPPVELHFWQRVWFQVALPRTSRQSARSGGPVDLPLAGMRGVSQAAFGGKETSTR